jgi:GNAT superfamily N-acetyltransferase
MMTPRLLHLHEVPRLLELGELFFKESKQKGVWNPGHFIEAMTAGIAGGIRFILVLDEDPGNSLSKIIAAFGAVVAKCDHTGDVIACETFFYAHPEARGKAHLLLKAYEDEAKVHGAKRIWMVHLENDVAERMAKWYERSGYSLKERLYEKVI